MNCRTLLFLPFGDASEFKERRVRLESGDLRNLDTLSYLDFLAREIDEEEKAEEDAKQAAAAR